MAVASIIKLWVDGARYTIVIRNPKWNPERITEPLKQPL